MTLHKYASVNQGNGALWEVADGWLAVRPPRSDPQAGRGRRNGALEQVDTCGGCHRRC